MMKLLPLLCLIASWIIVISTSKQKDEAAALIFCEWFMIGVVYCICMTIAYHIGGLK